MEEEKLKDRRFTSDSDACDGDALGLKLGNGDTKEEAILALEALSRAAEDEECRCMVIAHSRKASRGVGGYGRSGGKLGSKL